MDLIKVLGEDFTANFEDAVSTLYPLPEVDYLLVAGRGIS